MVTTTSVTQHTTHLPHALPALSTDATIFLVVIAVIAYAIFAGFLPLSRLAAGIYMGLVVATSFGATVYHMTQNGSVSGSGVLSQSTIRLALFVLPLALVQLGHPIRSHMHKVGMVWLLVLGTLTALLMVTAGLSVLDNATLQATLGQSNLASQIYNLRLPLIAAVPLAMAAAAIFHRKSHNR